MLKKRFRLRLRLHTQNSQKCGSGYDSSSSTLLI